MPSPRKPESLKSSKGGKRCIVYTRVSTDDQARKDYSSLESQKDICRSYIRLKQLEGWTELEVIEDGGYSAKSLDRPGMARLLAMVERGAVDVVVAYKLDRLSRSLPDFYKFWETLNKHGVEFVSATEQFDTSTSTGRLMLNLLMVFAQYERETTAARTTDKMAERAKHGLWNGGWAPFGYDFDAANKTIVPNETERAVVVSIFERLADGWSAAEVVQRLNKDGVRTKEREMVRGGQKRTGGSMPFSVDGLKATVRNVTYKGCLSFQGRTYPAKHPPLVSTALWEKANAAITPAKGAPSRRAERDKHNSLLKGIIFCGHCGSALTPHPSGKKTPEGKPYLYYMCTRVTKHGAASECTLRNLPARDVEDLVLRLMSELGRHPETIADAIAALERKARTDTRPAKTQLLEVEKQLRKAAQKVEHLLGIVKDSGGEALSRAAMADAHKAAEEKERLQARVEQLKMEIAFQSQAVLDAETVAMQLRDFEEVFTHLEPDEQKEAVRLLIREIRVNHADAPKAQTEASKGDSGLQLRTKCFVLNISFFANSVFSEIKRTGVNQFDFGPKWLPE